uniref:Uncharacterized protein n=1 Tax=Aeromonas hydrophila TaxID=644 RepID=A0A7S5Q3X5_AERHY|nr:Hypothetical protein [Aeromonas hydrophila]
MNSGPHAAKLRGYLTVSASSHRSCYPPDSKVAKPRNTGQRTHLTVGFLFAESRLRRIQGSDQDHSISSEGSNSFHCTNAVD